MKKFILQPEFTNFCNYQCKFCPHSVYNKQSESGNVFNRKKGYMSDELLQLVLENADLYAKAVIIGFFGEPLLHSNFEDYVEAFSANRNYMLEINTNWSLVTKRNMESLKQFDCVRISLDASNQILYDTLCPGAPVLDLNGEPCSKNDRYDVLTQKIEYWLSLPDHATTKIVYVISSINEHDRENFINMWQPRLTSQKDHVLTKSVLSYGGVMKDGKMSDNRCEIESQHWFTIAWDGECSPCNLDVNMELSAGNLFEAKDIKKIVGGSEWKQILSKIRKNRGICSNCFDANNWNENQYYFGYQSMKDGIANPKRKL